MIQSSYNDPAFSHEYMREIVRFFGRVVKAVDFDTIVVTGMSGLLVGPVLANKYRKGLLVLRKEPSAHSAHTAEGWVKNNARLLFVDDFVERGNTTTRVEKKIWSLFQGQEKKYTWVGAFFWYDRHVKHEGLPFYEGLPVYSIYSEVKIATGEIKETKDVLWREPGKRERTIARLYRKNHESVPRLSASQA